MEDELKLITIKATSGGITLREAVQECERFIISEALRYHGNDKVTVARLLQISLSSLYRKIGEEPPVLTGNNRHLDLDLE